MTTAETPERESELITAVQDWLNVENISNAKRDRKNILKFLQGCKYNLEDTKTKMKNFYEVRRTSEFFHYRDPLLKNIETLFNLGASYPLPNKSREGLVILIIKAAVNNPQIIPMTDVFKQNIMTVDLVMELDDDLTKNGVHVIIDMEGVGFHHGIQMTPTLIYKVVHLWQNCYPIKIKGIDFINSPTTIDIILNIFRKFLTEKLRKRVRTHGSQLESLHQYVDPHLLPYEYGGYLGPEKKIFNEWKSKCVSFRDWFLNDSTTS